MKTYQLCFRFLPVAIGLLGVAASRGVGASIEDLPVPPDDGKLRIVCLGAHPDDCELQAGGVGALWAQRGHHVLFVSVTNGDIGHWREAGGPLARRRKAEVEQAHRLLGVRGLILDIHDGELEPSLENRRTITRIIRRWKANLVLSHRPNDYHPDHRAVGVLAQDAAFMVTVPFFCPDAPALKDNPAFMYYSDRFLKPDPFEPNMVVDIDAVMNRKQEALAVMQSQFYEGGANGSIELLPAEPARQQARQADVRAGFARRNQAIAERFRAQLRGLYPGDKAAAIEHAEAFQLCEYGAQPNPEQLKRLFPFFAD